MCPTGPMTAARAACAWIDRGTPYVATHVGVQVFDRNGRSRGILPLPGGTATSVNFWPRSV